MAKKAPKTTTKTANKTILNPLDDRVIVKPQEAEIQTASGIYLPEGAKEKPQTGTILSAGPGKRDDDGKRVAMNVKQGDTVLYGKYSGTEIEIDGEKLMIMRESELLGVYE